jgi:hypothetical protein
MLKLLFPLIFLSTIIQAQTFVNKLANDSDAVFLNSTLVAKNKIVKIEFIERIDTNCFINYPLPPSPVNFIHHKVFFETNGLSEHYEWSFADNNSITINEPDAKSGRFFIINEYYFHYNEMNVTKINVSDASPVSEVNYSYTSDSIFQNIMYYQPDRTIHKKLFSYKKSDKSEIIRKNTGIKKVYYPKIQIINLGPVQSSQFYINDIPVSSYMNDKFEQKRFLMEIHPGLFVFFEISE